MKLGILGTGMIVKDVLTMYHELGVEKTYLFSTKKSKSQALELMKKYHLDKVYTDMMNYFKVMLIQFIVLYLIIYTMSFQKKL